jgi:hypothetical protein
MPVDAFIAEVMEILQTQPAVTEICVERVKACIWHPREAITMPSSRG